MSVLRLLVALTLLTTGSLCAQDTIHYVTDVESTCAANIDVGCEAQPQFWAGVDVLSWTPHMRGMDFAVTESGSALTIGSANVHDVDYDRDTGIRAQMGVATTVGWGVDVAYTHFESEGVNNVVRPAGTGQLFSSFSHPGGPEEADTATGVATLDYDVFDISARYQIVDRQHIGFDIFGGLRWADINQSLTSTFDGRDFDNGLVQNQADVNAFGFRFGGQSHWRLGSGFSLSGGVSAAALYGKIDNHRLETNFDGAQLLVDLRDAYVQPIFNFETALGVAYQRRSWFVTGGYEFNVWTNMGDSLRFVDDIEEGSFTSLSGDLLLEGFFFRVARAF